MKILSWNILHGGGQRINDIVDAIKAHGADLVCLQEFRHGKSKRALVDGLSDAGLTLHYLPQPASPRHNTVAVFSRLPLIDDQSVVLFEDTNQTARCIQVVADDAQFGQLRIVNVSLPHKKAQLPVFDMLLELPSSHRIEPTLLIGDFNCGIPFEDSETKSFYATHRFQSLLQQDWVDSWRSRYPSTREFSWFSTNKGNGFRYDHALASEPLDRCISAIRYDHAPREQRVSDHSILILECE